jgi:alpha-glucosidase (family GH31 glycosyl hydrolase)
MFTQTNILSLEHRFVHNAYGHFNARASFNGLLRRSDQPPLRPFLLTRSFFIGTQKYG